MGQQDDQLVPTDRFTGRKWKGPLQESQPTQAQYDRDNVVLKVW